uniref:Uncharacterized protein n=1 Tax=Cannabis sativa TaxID=3483 RepID=A0A803QBY6_CANSA
MLSWTNKGKIGKKDLGPLFSKWKLVVMKGLYPRLDEEAYAKTITYNDAEVHLEMKASQDIMMEQLRFILTILHNKPAVDLTPDPSMEEDVDVYPDGYDPYFDEAPSTPVDAAIIAIDDSQS